MRNFIDRQFHHFNAGELKRAAREYRRFVDDGGKMMLTLAGAMSTARLGISVAEMIRRGYVHAICTTGANLEEDAYNVVGREDYLSVVDHKNMHPLQEEVMGRNGFSRVTDVAMPESVMLKIDDIIVNLWKQCLRDGVKKFPHEFVIEALAFWIGEGDEAPHVNLDESWLLAAAHKGISIFVPGWEDSTEGNSYAAFCMENDVAGSSVVRGGVDYMMELAKWYKAQSKVGFFQIGGGIAGDFPICVVPMLNQDMSPGADGIRGEVPLWQYFAQISDSTTSYGSYSGALPREKITWGKLAKETPSFMIESDATICWPLIAAYVMGETL